MVYHYSGASTSLCCVDFNSLLEGVRRLYEEDVKSSMPLQPVDRSDWENVKGFVRRLGADMKSLKTVP